MKTCWGTKNSILLNSSVIFDAENKGTMDGSFPSIEYHSSAAEVCCSCTALSFNLITTGLITVGFFCFV